MLSCKETSLLVSQSRDRRLSWSERWAVRLHLWICEQCRRYQRQVAFFGWLAQKLEADPGPMTQAELSEAARERIRKAIEAGCHEGCSRRH
ncbi:MAG: zf-HC2 domain-containing protein [Hydrogenophilaceae bacterium]|nr:zf-HC2 domain-containing protein [Hydrogenophilaceae bacterium]